MSVTVFVSMSLSVDPSACLSICLIACLYAWLSVYVPAQTQTPPKAYSYEKTLFDMLQEAALAGGRKYTHTHTPQS